MLCDLKLSPEKEKAAANVLDEKFDTVVWVEAMLDRLVVDEVADCCLRLSRNCKLFANAFSCCLIY